jgi:hypothetical protein
LKPNSRMLLHMRSTAESFLRGFRLHDTGRCWQRALSRISLLVVAARCSKSVRR